MIASIPSPSNGMWELGPLPIRAYAVAIIVGIVVGLWMLDRRYVRKGGPKDVSLDIAGWMVIFGIIGARLYHIFTTPEPYFGENGDLGKIFRIWEGGLGIWGAIALGAVGAAIGLRRKGLRLAPFADAAAPGIMLGQAIGRIGNYFNQELYGRPTDVPWALEIDPENIVDGYPAGTTFHPTFLYELLWCVAGVVVILWLEKRFDLHGGQTFWLYVMIYTAGRSWIEHLRIDEAQVFAGLRLNVWTAILMFLIAAALFVWRTRAVRDPDYERTVWRDDVDPEVREKLEARSLEGDKAATDDEKVD